jgi:hypothetical protein
MKPTRADELYAAMLRRAQEDPNILGLFVGGSRGKGAATEHSDYDCDIVVADEVAVEYRARLAGDDSGFNLAVVSLSELAAYAAIGSNREWDRYNYAHLHATVDKLDGEIQRLIDEKGALPPEVARERLPLTIDAYINSTYRALKNARDGRPLAARLDAAESVPFLLGLVFMIHGRLRPYNKYLEWELTNWPLTDLPWSTAHFLRLIDSVSRGDSAAQRTVFSGVRALITRHGLEHVLAAWDRDAIELIESGAGQ